jgi:hypothetical protein
MEDVRIEGEQDAPGEERVVEDQRIGLEPEPAPDDIVTHRHHFFYSGFIVEQERATREGNRVVVRRGGLIPFNHQVVTFRPMDQDGIEQCEHFALATYKEQSGAGKNMLLEAGTQPARAIIMNVQLMEKHPVTYAQWTKMNEERLKMMEPKSEEVQ